MEVKVDICTVCNSRGKQYVRVDNIMDIVVDCIWCHGKGVMTEEERRRYKEYIEMWCDCGNPTGISHYIPDGKSAVCRKHHWVCADCGKVKQMG